MATLRITLLTILSLFFVCHQASALRVTNLTTGQVIFSDNFESAPANPAPHVDGSGDFDPVAQIGTWQINGFGRGEERPSDIQVTSSPGDPDVGPAQGNNYLRVYRTAADATYTTFSAYALFTPQTTPGHRIRFETMVAAQEGYNSNNGVIQMLNSTNTTGVGFNTLSFRANSQLRNTSTVAADFAPYTKGEWTHLVLEYTIGESDYDVVVDGVAHNNLGLLPAYLDAPPTDIVGFRLGSAPPDVAGALYFDAAPALPVLTINRTSGELVLRNPGSQPIGNIIGYSITSPGGALDPASWTSIAENYDTGAFDNVPWTALTDDGGHTDLSEAVFSGDGGTLAAGQSLNLGNAWIKSLDEDIVLELIIDNGTPEGELVAVNATFIPGASGLGPFSFGDLDFDGDFDENDFHNVFVPAYHSDTTGLSEAQQYRAGDFNGDGVTNGVDFVLLNQAYLSANPGAAALSFTSRSVPEPASLGLGSLAVAMLVGMRKRRSRLLASLKWGRIVAPLLLLAMVTLAPAAHAVKVTNLTTGQLLFYDNFDGVPSASSTPYPDPTGDYDPVALVGTWDIGSVGNGDDEAVLTDVQVTNSSTSPDPGRFHNNYLRLDRASAFVAAYATFPRQSTPGDVIRFETMFATSTDYNTSNGGFTLQDGTDLLTITTLGSGLTVRNRDAASVTSNVAGMTFTKGEWFPVVVDITIGGNSYDMTLNGVTVEDIPLFTANPIAGVDSFRPAATGRSGTNVGTVYVDAILENQLTVTVNKATGEVRLENNSGLAHEIDFYQLKSAAGALNPANWNSLQEQAYGGSPGNPLWTELGTDATELSEGVFGEGSVIANGQTISLGNVYNVASGSEDLAFEIHFAGTSAEHFLSADDISYVTATPLPGDFNADGTVDAADYVLWRNNLNGNESVLNGNGNGSGTVDAADYTLWKSRFGQGSGGALAPGVAQVPEPANYAILLLAAGGMMIYCTSKRSFAMTTIKALPLMALAMIALTSTSQAVVMLDRHYTMGDFSDGTGHEGATAANGPAGAVVSSSFNPPADVLDSAGPQFADLVQTGGPTYVSLSTGAYTRANRGAGNDFAVHFDGSDSFLTGPAVNALAETVTQGMQMWVYADSAKLGNGRQVIVSDSFNAGGPAISANGRWTQNFSEHPNATDIEATVPVVGNTWHHVAQHIWFNSDTAAPQVIPGTGTAAAFTSVLYVNGVAVSASNDASVVPTVTTFQVGGAGATATDFFQGAIDELTVYTSAPNGFDLFVDNEWIAARIAQIPGGALKEGDINFDGQVNSGDVTAFVAGWRNEKRFNGAHAHVYVADWQTLGWGDLNLDGRVNLRDALRLHTALEANGAAGLDFALLDGASVPEPATVALLGGLMLAGTLALKRRRA